MGLSRYSLSSLNHLQLHQIPHPNPGVLVVDLASSDRSFADSAAVIAEMDLIVTIDTAIAHIAGAFGKPVWNLLHWDSFWLYGKDSTTTPWYPGMRLYRQPKPGIGMRYSMTL